MKIRNIISDCLLKLGYGTAVDMEIDANRSAEENRIVDILLRCVSITYTEIVTRHFPNIVREEVVLTDNKLTFATLTGGKFVYAVSLKQKGEYQKIKVYPTFLESEFSGEATLEYCALPASYTLDTELPDVVPCQIIADGVTAEYAYAENMIDTGVSCERKFAEGLGALKCRGVGKYVKARRWS